MSDEDYRGLSQAELELQCGIYKIGWRSARREIEDIKNFLFRRVPDPAAGEATTEPARALPAPAPVASGSGQLVQAPALPGPPVRSSAPGSMRDRELGVERSLRSAHTRTRAHLDGGLVRSTPTAYVSLPSCGIDILTCHI
jgi:hypothetical protein